MSKQYELVGATTYGTATKIFRAGVQYSAEEVADVVDDANDAGVPYFAEVGAEEKEAGPKKGVLIVGGKKKAEGKKPEGEDGAAGDQSKGAGSTVVTV